MLSENPVCQSRHISADLSRDLLKLVSHLPQHGGCWLWLPREQHLKLAGLGESASEWVDKELQQCWHPAVTLCLVGLGCFDCLVFVSLRSEWWTKQPGWWAHSRAKHCTTTHSITQERFLQFKNLSLKPFFFVFCSLKNKESRFSSTAQAEDPVTFVVSHRYFPNWEMFLISSIPVLLD